jgi:glucose-6-phosphate isomerase
MSMLTESPAWRALMRHRDRMSTVHLRHLFAEDPTRFVQYSRELNGMLFDFSKQRINPDTLNMLVALADQADFRGWRERLFAGDTLNHTEGRAVAHMALRKPRDGVFEIDGRNVVPEVWAVLDQMRAFVDEVRSGDWKGYTGKPIRDVVNLGIGGSDLGPFFVCSALQPFTHDSLRVHFVSNLDSAHLQSQLGRLDPETTLFIVASKSFRTMETLTNALSARDWFLQYADDEAHIAKHFVAVSTQTERVKAFGIDPRNMFPFWDWVGGRYSVWSAIGLPVALAIGMEGFEQFLAGAHAMDEHFLGTDDMDNIPLIHGLLAVWNRNFLGASTRAVLPYDYLLRNLPPFLQQLDMESLGKGVDRAGRAVNYATGAVIWGEQGSNGQHAFFQFLHQGRTTVPVEFVASVQSHFPLRDHQARLMANLVAQAEALMRGRTRVEAEQELAAQSLEPAEVETLAPYKEFHGNVPSSTLLLESLTPFSLGQLIALYEHSVFVQGVIWNLNAYDQWGVELGKELADIVLSELHATPDQWKDHDESTIGLMEWIQRRGLQVEE